MTAANETNKSLLLSCYFLSLRDRFSTLFHYTKIAVFRICSRLLLLVVFRLLSLLVDIFCHFFANLASLKNALELVILCLIEFGTNRRHRID
jgi:hypothetical protein